MAFDQKKYMAVGSKVRVSEPMEVPDWSTWDDDRGRTSSSVKRRLQAAFFRGDRKVSAEVVYISRESEREKLRRQGRIKLRVREPSGAMLSITADPSHLVKTY
jgi:hypothetical protein